MNGKKGNPVGKKQSRHEASSVGKHPHILLAEDNDQMRDLLVMWLHGEGYKVTPCSNGVELLNHLGFYLETGTEKFDLIISDIRMPGLLGLEVLEGLNQSKAYPPMILITAFGDDETRRKAHILGASAVLNKPFDMEELMEEVHKVLLNRSASKAGKPLKMKLN